jgi:hypothetical protein
VDLDAVVDDKVAGVLDGDVAGGDGGAQVGRVEGVKPEVDAVGGRDGLPEGVADDEEVDDLVVVTVRARNKGAWKATTPLAASERPPSCVNSRITFADDYTKVGEM